MTWNRFKESWISHDLVVESTQSRFRESGETAERLLNLPEKDSTKCQDFSAFAGLLSKKSFISPESSFASPWLLGHACFIFYSVEDFSSSLPMRKRSLHRLSIATLTNGSNVSMEFASCEVGFATENPTAWMDQTRWIALQLNEKIKLNDPNNPWFMMARAS